MKYSELDTFGKRLEFILNEKDIKQIDLAQGIGVSNVTISRYVTGERKPTIDILKKISKFTDTSCDFYLMLTDSPESTIIEGVTPEGYKIEIELGNHKLNLTKEEINELIKDLAEVRYDVSKLIKKY